MPGILRKVKLYSILGGDVMSKPIYNGMTRCFADKWKEQEKCTVKGVEKSRFRDCCIYLSINGNRTCSNPNATKKE